MAFDRVPGMSIAFIQDDALWAKGLGGADLENRVPAASESSCRPASFRLQLFTRVHLSAIMR